MKWIIYALRRGTRPPFYVGVTKDWRRRLKEHKAFFGSRIILDLLEKGDSDKVERDKAEHYWIDAYRKLGYKLANKTEGGDGVETISAEARAALSKRWKGRIVSPEHRAIISATHKGKVLSAETREKLSAAAKRQFADPDSRQAHSEATKANTTPEQRSEWGRLGGKALMEKYPEAHITRMKEWWASMSAEEREAFSKSRAAMISDEKRSEGSKAGAKLREARDPGVLGRQVKSWWASLSPEDREAYLSRRTKAIRAGLERRRLSIEPDRA